jgi:hypothetical protein
VDERPVGGAEPHTIVYGRTRPGEPYVLLGFEGKTRREPTHRGGGFIFVFEGRFATGAVRVTLPGD